MDRNVKHHTYLTIPPNTQPIIVACHDCDWKVEVRDPIGSEALRNEHEAASLACQVSAASP